MGKYMVKTTARELAKTLIEDLGRETTANADRVSGYFELAYREDHRTEEEFKEECPQVVLDPAATRTSVVVSLVENVHNLDGDASYYGLHIIDDVTGADCELRYTNELTEEALVTLLDDLISEYKIKEV